MIATMDMEPWRNPRVHSRIGRFFIRSPAPEMASPRKKPRPDIPGASSISSKRKRVLNRYGWVENSALRFQSNVL